ncbi:hypothetical protein ONS95_014031 [Cadophora gregata]|uniref:uncharacterized protein n=1 Tax=Cadophora gregata TaxID=51156 RepID=UPI0026DCF198|nr:uncharacterized protein ONS95_014031 [Cadophora gregata]KAK0114541.1 hypothetical protein ONS95_014031 [Cadophora gregata]
MTPNNDDLHIELANLDENSQEPSPDHEIHQNEDEALVPLIDGQILGDESVKESPSERSKPLQTDEKFMEVFTQLAKERLEGMMGGLLEAMVEKLRTGQRRTQLDIEASAQGLSKPNTDTQCDNTQSENVNSSVGPAFETEVLDEEFWPFTATKTDDEIMKDEDERRRVLMNPKFDSIPDMWKHIWPAEWAEESLRHSLIKELVIVLHGYTTTDPYCVEGVGDLTKKGHLYSILSIIGGVVVMFCGEDSLDTDFHIVSPQPDHSFAIIVTTAIIEAIHISHRLRVDDLLIACFRRSCLFRPYMRSSNPWLQDINIAALAMFAVAMTDTCYYGPSLVLRDLLQDNDLQKLANDQVMKYYRHLNFSAFRDRDRLCGNPELFSTLLPTESATGSFRTYDLHLHSLVALGKLEIEWTHDARSHLRLRPYGDGRGCLHLFWFGCGTEDTSYYIAKLLVPTAPGAWESDRVGEWTELENTMRILLGHSSRSEERLTRKAYARLPIPWWLFSLCKTASSKMRKGLPEIIPAYFRTEKYVMGDVMQLFPDGIGGMAAHLSYKLDPNRSWSYSEFPIYGERLYQLRLHMDGVRPRGFRGLFKDKRDFAGK